MGADDAALLAQGKKDKPKGDQKIRREADRVRFPYAYEKHTEMANEQIREGGFLGDFDAKEACKSVEDGVVDTYQKIEDGVVDGYQKIEDGAVNGFRRISDFFIRKFFSRKGE